MYDGNHLAGKLFFPVWQDQIAHTAFRETIYAQNQQNIGLSCFSALSDQDLDTIDQGLGENAYDQLERFYQVCDQLPRSSGHHFWTGIHGRMQWKKLRAKAATILYISSHSLGGPKELEQIQIPDSETIPVMDVLESIQVFGLGFLASAQVSYDWTTNLSSEVFFQFATGGTLNKDGFFRHFISISPQIRQTQIFFNGGINAYSSNRGLHISGLSGHGYIVPGARIRYAKEKTFALQAMGALLWSHVKPFESTTFENAGKFYGVEFNGFASYSIAKWLESVFELNVFVPGHFFATPESPSTHISLRVGVSATF